MGPHRVHVRRELKQPGRDSSARRRCGSTAPQPSAPPGLKAAAGTIMKRKLAPRRMKKAFFRSELNSQSVYLDGPPHMRTARRKAGKALKQAPDSSVRYRTANRALAGQTEPHRLKPAQAFLAYDGVPASNLSHKSPKPTRREWPVYHRQKVQEPSPHPLDVETATSEMLELPVRCLRQLRQSA
ncbi:hypothetical protein LPJGGPFB_05261 [Ensifer adhaerens]|nr:hypothetical protein [Ensifer adhaerens]